MCVCRGAIYGALYGRIGVGLGMTGRKSLINALMEPCRCVLLFSALIVSSQVAAGADKNSTEWKDVFDLTKCEWSSTGRNNYFILEPGYQQVLEGNEENKPVKLQITVLKETKKIGNIETRVVEERETHNGKLEEVSLNYFAVCGPSNDVYYFGEAVDIYKNGKVDHHEGEWIAETGGAKAGLFMPAKPEIGERFYQELAPKVAMDRVEVVSNSETLKTPAGEFHDCLKTEETTPLEPGVKEYKVYAKDVGIIQDGDLLLRKYGAFNPSSEKSANNGAQDNMRSN